MEKSSILDQSSQSSYFGYMKEINAKQAKNQFGQFLDWAQSEPVRITKRGRSAGVFMSEEQFQRLRGSAWEQLKATVDTMRVEAKTKGLDEETLSKLLSDES
jgi:prevent-host-death family protein